MAISKVIYGGKTLIDLTNDNITADKLLVGSTAHNKAGEPIEGTCDYDANTQDANATAAAILENNRAVVRGVMVDGEMKNNGAVNGTITEKDKTYTIPQGFHDGSGTVGIDSTEKAKLIPANIREGVEILGVTGTMSGAESEKKQSKEVTPTKDGFTVLPDNGFTCLSQVVVKAIPYVESANSAGGITVTIA